MSKINEALLKAQKTIDDAKKNAQNPHLKSKYADLNSVREAVIPALNALGLILLQPMVTVGDKEYIQTQIIHSESGESVTSNTLIVCKSMSDPQAYGSGISYARRYGITSLLCIGAEDDDAQLAKNRKIQLKKGDDNWKKVVEAISNDGYSVNDVLEKYRMSKESEEELWAIHLR